MQIIRKSLQKNNVWYKKNIMCPSQVS